MTRWSSTDVGAASREETAHGTGPPAPLAADLRMHTTLAGYRLHDLVGRGGMGVVYRAEHVYLRRAAAVKLLHPELAWDEAFRERFLRESQIAASIQHPNIVTVYDAGEADGLLYIAMQYVDGTDLAALLKRAGRLTPDRALSIVGEVAAALDAAHALGVVHRDVKPANVMMDDKRCYLTDFGLTRSVTSRTALTARGQFVGTIDYMPPEQVEGGPLDARTDVYALGCVLYHTLVGSVPFAKDSDVAVLYAHVHEPPPRASDRNARLPEEIDAVLARALAKRRDDRYPSCSELITAATAALGRGQPGDDSPPPIAAPRRTVVVADSDAGVRALIRVTLDERRFGVFEAADGDAAVSLMRSERPDVLLVGWNLGGRPAPEVCAAVRAEGGADTKIVVLAARDDDEGAVRAAGADASMRKPFSSLQLLYTLERLVGAEALH
jgi:serine/threonine protein kinase